MLPKVQFLIFLYFLCRTLKISRKCIFSQNFMKFYQKLQPQQTIFQISQFSHRFQTSSGHKIWTNGFLWLKFWIWCFFISIFHNTITYQNFIDPHPPAFSYFLWFLGAIALKTSCLLHFDAYEYPKQIYEDHLPNQFQQKLHNRIFTPSLGKIPLDCPVCIKGQIAF